MIRKRIALFGFVFIGIFCLTLMIQQSSTEIKAAEETGGAEELGTVNASKSSEIQLPSDISSFDSAFSKASEQVENVSVDPRASGVLYESVGGILSTGDTASLKQGVFADGWMLSPYNNNYTFNPYPTISLASGWYTTGYVSGAYGNYTSQARYKANGDNSITFGSRFNATTYPTDSERLINDSMITLKKPGILVVPNTNVNLSMSYKFTGLDLAYRSSQTTFMLAWYFDVNGQFIANSMVYPTGSQATANNMWYDLNGTVRVPSNAHSMAVGIYTMSAGKVGQFYDLDLRNIRVAGEIPQPVVAAPITVKYVNQNNVEIASSYVQTGNVGDEYTLTPKDIAGYTWDGNYPTGWNGIMGKTPTTLTYKYSGNTVTNVYAQYLDIDTNESIKTQTALPAGKVGNTYTKPTAPVIGGYDFVKSEGGSGTYTTNTQYIKYYYKQEKIQQYWGTAPVDFDAATGTLTVSAGTLTARKLDFVDNADSITKTDVKKIILQEGVVAPANSEYLFSGSVNFVGGVGNFKGFDNLISIEGSLNTSQVTIMRGLFQSAKKLETVDVGDWDTSKVTNAQGVFNNTTNLVAVDVSKWDMSKVTNMSTIFSSTGLTTVDVSDWDTSKVTDMNGMFRSAKIKTADLSKWNTSNVLNMSQMFRYTDLETVNLSKWDTSKVTNMSSMFSSATSITTLDLSSWDTSKVTDMSDMFGSTKLDTIKLGSKSLYDDTVNLPEVDTTSERYTGAWERTTPVSPPSVYASSTEFMTNYNGLMPGTYKWQVVKIYTLSAESAGKKQFVQESEPDIELKDWVKNVRLIENEAPESEAFEPEEYTVTFKTPNALDTSAVGEQTYTLEVKTTYNGKTYTTTVDVPVEIIAGELSLDVPTALVFEEAFTQTNKRQVVSREDPDWSIKIEDTRAPSQRTNWDLNVRIVDDFTLNSSDNRKHSLSDILVYKENAASDSVFLSEASYPIFKSSSQLPNETTKKWSAESGFLLEVSRLKSLQIKNGEYDATLEFQLLVGP